MVGVTSADATPAVAVTRPVTPSTASHTRLDVATLLKAILNCNLSLRATVSA
jgi:hypothetical protein